MSSFLSLEATARLKKNQRLLLIASLINWPQIVLILGNMDRSGRGPGCYEPVTMVKALILQQWHSLSDAELEETLGVRLDFMLFTDFESEVPDETVVGDR